MRVPPALAVAPAGEALVVPPPVSARKRQATVQEAEPPRRDSSSWYHHQLSRQRRLLTPDEVNSLAVRIQRLQSLQATQEELEEGLGRPATDREVARVLGLPSAVELRRLRERGEAAKRLLVSANFKLVIHIARFYMGRGLSFDDLVQEGSLGLIRAAERFDPERNIRLSTYATYWVRQAMSRAVMNDAQLIRVPVYVQEAMRLQRRGYAVASEQLGRPPTPAELARALGQSEGRLQRMRQLSSRQAISLDSPVTRPDLRRSGQALTVERTLADVAPGPEERLAAESTRRALREILREKLDDDDYAVLDLRFGLSGGEEMQRAEIATQLNETRGRVVLIEKRALRRLRSKHLDEIKERFSP